MDPKVSKVREAEVSVLEGAIPFLVSHQRMLPAEIRLDHPGMMNETIIYNPQPVTLPD